MYIYIIGYPGLFVKPPKIHPHSICIWGVEKIVDSFVKIKRGDICKKETLVEILTSRGYKKALVVTAEVDENVTKSARNIEGVTPVAAASINVYDLLRYQKLVLTVDAIKKLEEVYA